MKPPWYRRNEMNQWLLASICVLAVAVGFKEGTLSKRTIVQDKDFFDSVSKLASVVAIAIGGALSYFRFFRGRTFSEKLILIPTSGTVTVVNGKLHWLEVEMKNIGPVTIWNYSVRVVAQFHDGAESQHDVTEFAKWPDESTRQILIDVGESAYEHAFLFVPNDVHAVTFRIIVTSEKGASWSRCLTVSNQQ